MLTFHIKGYIHIRNNTRRFLSIISNYIYHLPPPPPVIFRGWEVALFFTGVEVSWFLVSIVYKYYYFLVDFCGKKYILSQQLTYIYLFGENRKLLIIVRKMTTAQIGLNQSTNCIGFHSSNIDSLIVIN